MLVRMGQQGQIRGQVTDEALKGLLEQVRACFPLDLITFGIEH
jgi:DNA-binding TFAR19-related protein (PDSD5 family)